MYINKSEEKKVSWNDLAIKKFKNGKSKNLSCLHENRIWNSIFEGAFKNGG